MFIHNKRLQYTVRVATPNPGLANLLLEQFGGPQGELAAACRYFTQAVGEDDPGRKDLLFDIATEELSHLEIIGSIVAMLNKGAKGQLAEGVEQEAELYRSLTGAGNDSHITSILYGGGPPLTNSAGVPWTAAYIDTIGEPTADLRSNIAAEARAKIVYERLINVTDDPGIKDALGFLMTREIAHQKSFEKALHSIQPNFPQGKLPGNPEFTNVYFNMSKGDDARGPWNEGGRHCSRWPRAPHPIRLPIPRPARTLDLARPSDRRHASEKQPRSGRGHAHLARRTSRMPAVIEGNRFRSSQPG
jgi:Mn-containing catalase